ncbi:protein chain elongation factor EF-G [Candidatus Nasuia deltocephalinicola]|uniref:Elongation factor G n=1 Tax=Candidatus Nasuia deltocephalincola TaxID=1160784 RepID=A0A975A3Q0_9PROT|nr:elongation factor G [Candidatus Nasuia deltocephalinicola]BEH03952.1 protein chain elongation factor EF-G [Candidatus Nasuia deltocephalinicola]
MFKVFLNNFRNIGISAHIDAGKTTTTERILYYAGVNYKIGEVHEGKATMDWMDQEQERGITINSASTTVFWKNFVNKEFYKINIIDTPGHVDFTIEVERSMRVIDGACMIYCAVSGIQSQSESVWRQSIKHGVSKIIFINKMDRIGNNFYKIYEDLKNKLKANPLPVYIPYFFNNCFNGLIDLLNYKLLLWNERDNGMTFSYFDIPSNYLNLSLKWRNNLIDICVSDSDDLISKYFNNVLNNIDIVLSIRKKTISNYIQPMLCGSSFKNKGVQCLLDCITNYLPSPLDFSKIKVFSHNNDLVDLDISDNKFFIALAFKIISYPFIGQLVFFRVYSGKLSIGDYVLNSNKNKKEKISRILRIHANHKEDIKFVERGDIVAAPGLKTVTTGDTLCDINNFIILDSISFPEPVISQSLFVNDKLDEEKVLLILDKFSKEDPSFTFHIDNNTKQIIISGMGELHLEVTIEKIRREYNINLFTEKPKVSYKETSSKPVFNIEGKYIRQSGGRGQYGHVFINLEPAPRGTGSKFINRIKSGSIPKEYIKPIEKSFSDCLNYGCLKGFPIIDVIVYLIDGSYHEVDSSENAFKIAFNIAFKEAFKNSNPIILEPIMIIDVEVPLEFSSLVLSDLSSKRGILLEISDIFNDYKLIKCNIPLSEIFNYSTVLRSLTKGRGSYNSRLAFYSEIPLIISKNIL